MATRTISTKLAIEGESEYKASLSRINSEIRSLQSALKLTESEYQTNANSMDALTAKGNALSNLYQAQQKKVDELKAALDNARKAESDYAAKKDELNAKIKANNNALEAQSAKVIAAGKSWANQAEAVSRYEEELEELRSSTKDTSAAEAELEKKIAAAKEKMAALEEKTGGAAKSAGELIAENRELNDELEKNEARILAAEKGVTEWQDKLNKAQIKLNDLDAEIRLNDEYLEEASNSADGCATSIDRFGDRVQAGANQANELRDALVGAGVIAALRETARAIESCTEESIKFESAMAGVRKTTDLTDEEFAKVSGDIQDMTAEMPASAEEIAGVAEAAGQLGIAKADLLDFSAVMINLGVATNLSSSEAASSLAKFANVVGMSADNYERLGSTIVDLGNNFATTEADIVSMATRLASSGNVIGLSEPQIMAVATALSSVGIEAEAGGSAISKLLKQFETMVATGSPALADFADVAGMTADEFSTAWGEDAVGALSKFINGLHDIDANGGSAAAILDELGIKETRLSNAVLSLASSNGILDEALSTANTAWKDNTALVKEAETRYATTESKMQLLSNAAATLRTSVGDKLTPALRTFADTGAKILRGMAEYIDENEEIVPLIMSAVTALGTFAAGIGTCAAALKVAKAAMAAFNLVMNANSVMVTVTAVTALAAGIGVLIATADSAVPSVEDLTEKISACSEAFEKQQETFEGSVAQIGASADVASEYIEKLVAMEEAGVKTEEQQREYARTVEALQQLLPDVNLALDEQTGLIEGGASSLWETVRAWQALAVQQAMQDSYTEAMKACIDAAREQAQRVNELNAAQAEYNTLSGRATELENEMADVRERRKALDDDESLSLWEKISKRKELIEQEDALKKEYVELSGEIDKSAKLQRNLQEAVDQGAGAVDDYKQRLEDMGAALGKLPDAMQSAVDGMNESGGLLSTDFITGLIDGLYEKQGDAANAGEEIGDALVSGTRDSLDCHSPSRKGVAIGKDYDAGIALGVRDNASEVRSAVSNAMESLPGQTKTYGEEAAETFSAGFSSICEKTTIALDNMRTNIKTETDTVKRDMQTVGKDMVDGMIAGLNSRSSRLYRAITSIVDEAIERAKKAADTHSPSKKTEKIFGDVGEGMVVGIEAKRERVRASVQDVVDAALKINVGGDRTDTILSAIDTHMPTVPIPQNQEQRVDLSNVEARIQSLEETTKGVAEAIRNLRIVLDTGETIGGLEEGIDESLGRRTVEEERRSIG